MRDPLPNGWALARVGELGRWSGGGTPSKSQPEFWEGGDIPWVSPKDMKTAVIHDTEDRITPDAVSGSAVSLVGPRSVLIVVRSGILKHTLPVAVNAIPVTVNQDMKALTPAPGIRAEYVAWMFRAFERDILHACAKAGTTVQSIEMPRLLEFQVPIPPEPEQRRIVAAIEEHLSRLDAASTVLRRIARMLPIARASVLEAAIDGTLAGSVGVSYEATPQPLGNVIVRIEAGRSFRCEERPPGTGEVGVVKVSAVTWGEFDEKETKTVRERDRVEKRFFIRKGDFLFSRANTIELVGACVLVKTEPSNLMLSDKILRFVLTPDVRSEWLLICLRSRGGRREIERLATGNQESMRNIGQDRIKQIVIPVPGLDAQAMLSAEVDARLSQLTHVEQTVGRLLGHADRLRQSILQRAFSGQWVTQDLRDEPADVLLDRIRRDRTAGASNAPVRRRSA